MRAAALDAGDLEARIDSVGSSSRRLLDARLRDAMALEAMTEPIRSPIDEEIRSAFTRGAAREAVALAVTSWGPEVLSFLAAVHGNREDASEVFAQTCEDLVRSVDTFRGECSVRTWFYALAKNASRRHFADPYRKRQAGLSQALELEEPVRSVTATFLQTEWKNKLFGLLLLVCSCGSDDERKGNSIPTIPPGNVQDAGAEPVVRSSISWSSGPALPLARDHQATFVVDPGPSAARFLYVAGGYLQNEGSLTADIARAPIGDDGALGPWEKAGALPIPVSGAGVAVTHGLVILTGGFNASTSWVAPIQPDGSLGAWKEGPKLPGVRFHASAVAFADFVYVIGGLADTKTTDEIARTTINSNGVLGQWEVVARLPYSLSHHAVALDGSTLYVISGQTGNTNDNSGTPHKEVQITTLGADGSVGAWTEGPALPDSYLTHASMIYGGTLFVIGGVLNTADESTGVPTANVLSTRILSPGVLDTWSLDNTSVLPAARSHVHHVPIYKSHAYSVSGRYAYETDEPIVNVGALQ